MRRPENPNPKMTYLKWVDLMDGEKSDVPGKKMLCPKQVGEWELQQESQITGMEAASLRFEARLSPAQVRWNFLRSQAVEVAACGEMMLGAGAEKDAEPIGLTLSELLECIARCGVDKYAALLDTWLPTHGRKAMTRADAVRGMLMNVLGERDEEAVLREATVVRAERLNVELLKPLGGRPHLTSQAQQIEPMSS